MTNVKKLSTWTLILNIFIIVGAGHGLGFLGLIEIFWLPHFYGIGTEDFSLSISGPYDKTLGFAALLSLCGQIILLVSFAVRKQNKIFWLRVFSLLLLWIGFFYLIYNLYNNPASMFGFVTGLPFLVVSIILAFKTLGQKKGNPYNAML